MKGQATSSSDVSGAGCYFCHFSPRDPRSSLFISPPSSSTTFQGGTTAPKRQDSLAAEVG